MMPASNDSVPMISHFCAQLPITVSKTSHVPDRLKVHTANMPATVSSYIKTPTQNSRVRVCVCVYVYDLFLRTSPHVSIPSSISYRYAIYFTAQTRNIRTQTIKQLQNGEHTTHAITVNRIRYTESGRKKEIA
jgi:hypothetical protein